MNFTDERASIATRFQTMWADQTPASYPNQKFDVPADFAPFVRLQIVNGDSNNVAVVGDGSMMRKHLGRIWVQIFVELGTGTDTARQLADAAVAIFDNARFDGIRCYAAAIKEVGADGMGYYQLNVSVPYNRYQ